MNKILKKLLFSALSIIALSACDTDIENIMVQHPIEHDETYYENLRAYKKSDHQLAFGWFGGWTATGNSPVKYLRYLPDSIDIVAIWSSYHSLSAEQIDDLKYVQEKHGTRVVFTVFSHNISNFFKGGVNPFPNEPEYIPEAAKALCDSIFKYGYDGIDFDHECSGSDLFYNKTNMTTLLREMRKNLGPDKLILVDGNVSLITEEGWRYANYAVSQAYATGSPSRLQSRYNGVKAYISPERFIVTENFESYWQNGGVNYSDPELGTIPSLLGMAHWQPEEVIKPGQHKGGCGTYHMEYEYYHTDSEYKYIRQAIQIMNPAGK